MNERIKELWEQCKTPFWSIDNQSYDQEKFARLIIEEAAKAPLCDTDGVVGKYSDSDRYYFEQLMKQQLGVRDE